MRDVQGWVQGLGYGAMNGYWVLATRLLIMVAYFVCTSSKRFPNAERLPDHDYRNVSRGCKDKLKCAVTFKFHTASVAIALYY